MVFSNLPSGGVSATSRSSKCYKGSGRCVNSTPTAIFEFSGSGKVNQMILNSNLNTGSGSYLSIVVDDSELYQFNGSLSTNTNYYLFRTNNGVLTIVSSYSSGVLPLDIEFKKSFKILFYATNDAPLISYTFEIAAN